MLWHDPCKKGGQSGGICQEMPALPVELDLRGIAWPLSLLELKRRLAAMGRRGVLEVHTEDPDLAEDILRILQRSEIWVGERVPDRGGLRLRIHPRNPNTEEERQV